MPATVDVVVNRRYMAKTSPLDCGVYLHGNGRRGPGHAGLSQDLTDWWHGGTSDSLRAPIKGPKTLNGPYVETMAGVQSQHVSKHFFLEVDGDPE